MSSRLFLLLLVPLGCIQTCGASDDETVNAMKEMFSKRKDHLKQQCDVTLERLGGFRNYLDWQPQGSFLYAPDQRIAFCLQNRIARKVWRQIFTRLNRLDPAYTCPGQDGCTSEDNEASLQIAANRTQINMADTILWTRELSEDGWAVTLAVRHPFEHLLSVFLSNRPSVTNQVNKATNGTDLEVPFSKFVDFVLTDRGVRPPFLVHQAMGCNLCASHFSHIVRYDDLFGETHALGAALGLTDYLKIPQEKPGQNPESVESGKPTKDLLQKYFGGLTREQVTRMKQYFQPELDFFQYPTDEYEKWAKE